MSFDENLELLKKFPTHQMDGHTSQRILALAHEELEQALENQSSWLSLLLNRIEILGLCGVSGIYLIWAVGTAISIYQ